jgi:hypothetical protein
MHSVQATSLRMFFLIAIFCVKWSHSFSYLEDKAFRHGDIVRLSIIDFFFQIILTIFSLSFIGRHIEDYSQERRRWICAVWLAHKRIKIWRFGYQESVFWVRITPLRRCTSPWSTIELTWCGVAIGYVITVRCLSISISWFYLLNWDTKAVDIAGLKKLQLQVCSRSVSCFILPTHLTVSRLSICAWSSGSSYVCVLSFTLHPSQTFCGWQAHGYATHEFEVTAERLGVYLPVSSLWFVFLSVTSCNRCTQQQTEHIDNPKGYGEGEDARQYHPLLRPPVDVSIYRSNLMHFSFWPSFRSPWSWK